MDVSPKGFTHSTLKKNYHNLSRIYHPDKNPELSAAEKFREIKLAYDILSSSEKRQSYDLY